MNAPQENTSPLGLATLQVPARFSYLRIIRQGVLDLCARANLSEFAASQLEMAVDEACANVIEHSYGGASADSRFLSISLIQHADHIVVELCDHGRGFDPETCGQGGIAQYLDERRERGLGMLIIRKFIDDISYERGTPRGNCLRLVKRIG